MDMTVPSWKKWDAASPQGREVSDLVVLTSAGNQCTEHRWFSRSGWRSDFEGEGTKDFRGVTGNEKMYQKWE
jgi:hypothetical protein